LTKDCTQAIAEITFFRMLVARAAKELCVDADNEKKQRKDEKEMEHHGSCA
jgi:hypothetical protein